MTKVAPSLLLSEVRLLQIRELANRTDGYLGGAVKITMSVIY